MAATPGFKSQPQSSSAAPFPAPPTIGYTCQQSRIFPAFLGCHSNSRQVWPHGMEPTISKLSCRHCNQGEWPPNYVLSQSHSHLPCSKHGHSCQHSSIFPAFLGCHSKSGQAWPCGVEPIISKLSCRHCNQGELPPSYILGGSHFHPPGSKHGHSYLTYP